MCAEMIIEATTNHLTLAAHAHMGQECNYYTHSIHPFPKMVGLYKDPKGEDIFNEIAISNSLSITKDSNGTFNRNEMEGLRQRIKELETEIKDKDVRIAIDFVPLQLDKRL